MIINCNTEVEQVTEQEAIKALTYLKAACTNKSDTVKALDTAIKALKEVQQYRKIGAVEA